MDVNAVVALHRERKAQGHDRADAGRQSRGLRPGRDRRRRRRPALPREAERPTRSPATRSTPASTCSSRTRSIAFRRTSPYSIERGYFPSLVERSETFVAYIDRGYWIDIGTPEKYIQVHRDMFDGRFAGGVFAAGRSRRSRSCRPRRASKTARCSTAPCFIDAGAHVKSRRARSAPTPCSAAARGRGGRRGRRTPSSGRTRASASTRVVRRRHHRPQLPHRPQRPC